MSTRTHTKRWTAREIEAGILALDKDFEQYEATTGILHRAGFATTPELVALEKVYQQCGVMEVEYRIFEKFPVSGVFIQGIEGYATYRGDLYRLLKLASLTPRSNGAIQCALLEEAPTC